MPEAKPDTRSYLVLGSSALPDGELAVRQLEGVERISQPYEFHLVVQTGSGEPLEDAELEALLTVPSYVAFGREHEHKTWGVLARIEAASMVDAHQGTYRVTLVPRLACAALSVTSRVFLDKHVPEIVHAMLHHEGLGGEHDFVARCGAVHPAREYTVQYQESNLAFLSRLLEAEGIWYVFHHDGEREQLWIGDANVHFPALPEHDFVDYHPVEGGVTEGAFVTSLERVRQLLPKRLRLREYNESTPAVALDSARTVDPAGRGELVLFGENFGTPAEGARLSALRTEQWHTQRWTYRGRSRLRGLRAGHHFQLRGHFLPQLDQRYLVTEVRHHGEQGVGGQDGYYNDFVAVPYNIPYRPPVVTPRPKIAGVIPGRVDGGSARLDDHGAPIDARGRYKVNLMVDPNQVQPGHGSCWIRVAQLTANQGYGMHMPLHGGTEVLIAHLDGDPDRPVIVGAVANGASTSPVVQNNATQAIIRTRQQIEIHFDDDA